MQRELAKVAVTGNGLAFFLPPFQLAFLAYFPYSFFFAFFFSFFFRPLRFFFPLAVAVPLGQMAFVEAHGMMVAPVALAVGGAL